MREETDGKPFDALDGSFLRPFLGERGADRVFDAFGGMSDAMRMAQEMQRAMQDIFPGARACGSQHIRETQYSDDSAAPLARASVELEGTLQRRQGGGEGGASPLPEEAERRRGLFGGLLPRRDAPPPRSAPKRHAWEPTPGTKYEEV